MMESYSDETQNQLGEQPGSPQTNSPKTKSGTPQSQKASRRKRKRDSVGEKGEKKKANSGEKNGEETITEDQEIIEGEGPKRSPAKGEEERYHQVFLRGNFFKIERQEKTICG